jgi:hypothetical protein
MTLSFIRSSGNIITEDFCLSVANETKAEFVKDKSFGTSVKKVDEIIATTFEKLRERWEENRGDIINNRLDNTSLRKKWILPFLQSLGYEPQFVPGNIKAESGLEFHIPYKGWDSEYAPLLHLVPSVQDLDAKDKDSRTHKNKSPQDCLQLFLNSSHHQWSILTNGKRIRLLRDFYHSITKGFLEFDLEGIFEKADTEQFRILYRILHRSRMENQFKGDRQPEYDDEGNPIETEDGCLLEEFHKKSRETGVKVGNHLRDQVVIAIEKLGSGFAESLNPDEYQGKGVKEFYSEILSIIYRLLFLMFAEQKGWLPVRNNIYARTYSVNALRELAEKGNYNHDDERDLWEGLKTTFHLVAKGYKFKNGDEINAFGGQLFSDKKIAGIKDLRLKNKYLLDAIFYLSYFKHDKLSNRINYANLAIDELGSVYESLLDYEPKIATQPFELVLSESGEGAKKKTKTRNIESGEFYLDPRGTDRKTTGSYYTDSRLVAQLIESALVPVIENALKEKATQDEKEQAILDLKVADIACGSGAFLCAALEKLGEELALIRMGDEERPTDEQLREAKRDVLLHCIYGVDLNPMALELAKFSLWITASLPDMPLTFLDHKLKCGNSLIGATPKLIELGIPEEAYKPIGSDNPAVCAELKKRVKKQRERLQVLKEPTVQYGLKFERRETDELLRKRKELEQRKQELPDDVDLAEEEYRKLEEQERTYKAWLMADVWTSSFLIDKKDTDLDLYPTNVTIERLKENEKVNEVLVERVLKVADEYNFFHYHLEFPEVFENGGFDCLLGNPPWEKIQAEEVEFFAPYNPRIANESDAKTRKQLIANLEQEDIELYRKWKIFKDALEKISKFCISSGLFEKSAIGNINLYKIFLDKSIQLINKEGRVGLIVQSGLFTDELSKDFFEELMKKRNLISVNDFVNKKKLFGIHPQMRFSLITACSRHVADPFFRFYLIDPEQIINPRLGVYLDLGIIKRVSPNTGNCPMINDQKTLDILNNIYKNSIIVSSENSTTPSYQCAFWGEMFNMTRGEKLLWNKLHDVHFKTLPLYESKYFHQYDHRYATFKDVGQEDRIKGNARMVKDNEKRNQEEIEFRYYVRKETVIQKCNSEKYNVKTDWLLCLRSITSSTNERTVISAILPKVGIANSVNIVLPKAKTDAIILLGAFNSFVDDFVAYTKVGNQNLNIFIIKQLPVPTVPIASRSFHAIKDKILRLCYTSAELRGFGRDFEHDGEPTIWNSKERFHLQCELDAIYAHLYGLQKEEMGYILETFPIVKRKDIAKYGTYRTKETILQMYDEFSWVREEMVQTQTTTLTA